MAEDLVDRFISIYDADAFTSLGDLFTDIGVIDETQETLADYLHARGVSQLFIDELASIATRVNYGQSESTISAFAGLVTLVAMNSKCYQVAEGNEQLVQAMLQAANATVHLNSRIESINRPVSFGFNVSKNFFTNIAIP